VMILVAARRICEREIAEIFSNVKIKLQKWTSFLSHSVKWQGRVSWLGDSEMPALQQAWLMRGGPAVEVCLHCVGGMLQHSSGVLCRHLWKRGRIVLQSRYVGVAWAVVRYGLIGIKHEFTKTNIKFSQSRIGCESPPAASRDAALPTSL
jgi:hypothetical protein